MDQQDHIEIAVPRRIDLAAAQDLSARLRSVLRNGRTRIALRFSPGSSLCSSEFIGYLVAAAKHVGEAGGSLVLRGLDRDNRNLLAMLRLDDALVIDDGGAP